MNRERVIIVNGNKIEEYYWGGKYVVYKNDKLIACGFDEVVKMEQDCEINYVRKGAGEEK